MPRNPRHQEPGATYHVTTHSLEGIDLVRDDRDLLNLLGVAATVVARYEWQLLVVCILDTHYHFLLTTTQANLSDGMRYLNGSYAQLYNRRHRRRGHLFRERFRSKFVQSQAHLLLAVRYIALNPVAAGLVTDCCSFQWSSYPGLAGVAPCWPFIAKDEVLGLFGSGQAAVSALRDFVEGNTVAGEQSLDQENG